MGVAGGNEEALGYLAVGAGVGIVGERYINGLCILKAGSKTVNAGLGFCDDGLCRLLAACGLCLLGFASLRLFGKQQNRSSGSRADGSYDKPFFHYTDLRKVCSVFNIHQY